MTTTVEARKYDWRAEALAEIALARRTDLRVQRPENGSLVTGRALRVDILTDGVPTGQQFSVVALASLRPHPFAPPPDHRSMTLGAPWRGVIDKIAKRQNDAPFPVLLVAFEMKTDEGYFGWIRRPNVGGPPGSLMTNRPKQLQALNRSSIDGIITLVRGWYTQRSATPPS